MTEIIYYVAASLDGYIATPDGSIDWLAAYNVEDEDYGFSAFYQSVDALVEGSKTYEQALGFGAWPHPGKPCWVCTRRSFETKHAEVTFTSASPQDVVAELRRRQFGRVWLVGGAQLAASFRSHRLIDQYVVSVVPTLLGSGIPLFGAASPQEKLKLDECKQYSTGLVQLSYMRDGSA